MSANATEPLQVVPRERYAELVTVLMHQLPGSLKVIGHLKSNQKSEKWIMCVYVDSWPDPCVVLVVDNIYEGVRSANMDVIFHAVDNEKLRSVLSSTKVLQWQKTISFKVLDEIKPKGSVLKEEIRADVHICENGEKLHKGLLPDGYRISPLKKSDIDSVMKVWKFGSGRLRERFLLQVATHFSAGIYSEETGNLVSWAIQMYFGAIGSVNTLELHRHRGLAKSVISFVAQKMLQCGEIPWAHVEDVQTKDVSQHMVTSLGFKKSSIQHVWLICNPVK
ncbi:glycine N-acyltransferase-like protein 3 isoform X2 [Ptychodera flava]|uniref:glycine N-acyltransferase-like protein 3 isoform X2 n=1 Tax=Ptychodera flava TaxID=63121 RepID=UPI003969C0D6